MQVDLNDQAYALALLSGPPLFDVSKWSECVVDLAQQASVTNLLNREAVRQLADRASDLEREAGEPTDRCSYRLLSEWLECAVRAVSGLSGGGELGLFTRDAELVSIFNRARVEMERLGLSVPEKTHFEVTDAFPAPFDRADWSAFCPDPEDERRFGIRAGIYLRRDRIRPFQSACLVAHELIHVVPGLTGGNLLAMGLEEGIADVLGSVLLARRLVPPTVSENVFTYSRWGPHRPLSAAYLDHSRQAFAVYCRYGVQGLVSLLNEGRTAIHTVERLLTMGEFPSLDVKDVEFHPSDFAVVVRLLQTGLGHLVVSPVEYCVARAATSGLTVTDVSTATDLDTRLTAQTLKALSKRTMMIVMSGDRIEFSNFELYTTHGEEQAPTTLRVDFGRWKP